MGQNDRRILLVSANLIPGILGEPSFCLFMITSAADRVSLELRIADARHRRVLTILSQTAERNLGPHESDSPNRWSEEDARTPSKSKLKGRRRAVAMAELREAARATR